jgi:hypothetical protein
MIKHYPSVLQIPSKLHLHNEACSTSHAIYQHLENEKPFVLQLDLGSSVPGCNHNDFWTSIQGCYQYNHPLNNA